MMKIHPYFLQFFLLLFLLTEGICMLFLLRKKRDIYHHLLVSKISFVVLLCAILGCVYVYLLSDVRYIHVFQNSHMDQRWYMKIASIWSHHETSLFFWFCTFYFSNYYSKSDSSFLKHVYNFLFMVFIVFESNPFAISQSVLIQENAIGLNPLLYDLHMVWHPPLLYLGQVLTFPLFLKSLDKEKIDKNTVFLPIFVLTIAIATGSLWAFTQLGWGGFWFWDPVETLSIFPWFLLLIIVHLPSQYLQNRAYIYQIPFLSVIFSAWLIRSGIISSVHSFAESNTTFWFMAALFLGTLCIYAVTCLRVRKLHKIFFNIPLKYQLALFIFISTLAILLFGILHGLWTNDGLNEKFYHQLLTPLWILGIVFLLYISFCTFYKKQNKTKKLIYLSLLLAGTTALYVAHFKGLDLVYGVLGATSACAGLLQLLMLKNKTFSRIAHAGISAILVGLCLHSNSMTEKSTNLVFNQKKQVNQYEFLWNKNTFETSKFVNKHQLSILIKDRNKNVSLYPYKLYFHTAKQQRCQADYKRLGMDILMIADVEVNKGKDQELVIKFYHKSGIIWIVIGVIAIILSIMLNFLPRCLLKYKK